MANVHDVAAYVLEKAGRMSTMKLQKLVYYSQAWHLVWAEEQLFPEPIQAWVNGPVVRALFEKHRGQFSIEAWPDGDSSALSPEEKGTIDAVLASYNKYSGQQLSALSHNEGPWQETRAGLAPNVGTDREIDPAAIQAYYSGVAADGASLDV